MIEFKYGNGQYKYDIFLEQLYLSIEIKGYRTYIAVIAQDHYIPIIEYAKKLYRKRKIERLIGDD